MCRYIHLYLHVYQYNVADIVITHNIHMTYHFAFWHNPFRLQACADLTCCRRWLPWWRGSTTGHGSTASSSGVHRLGHHREPPPLRTPWLTWTVQFGKQPCVTASQSSQPLITSPKPRRRRVRRILLLLSRCQRKRRTASCTRPWVMPAKKRSLFPRMGLIGGLSAMTKSIKFLTETSPTLRHCWDLRTRGRGQSQRAVSLIPICLNLTTTSYWEGEVGGHGFSGIIVICLYYFYSYCFIIFIMIFDINIIIVVCISGLFMLVVLLCERIGMI